jgi:hypothetical protein
LTEAGRTPGLEAVREIGTFGRGFPFWSEAITVMMEPDRLVVCVTVDGLADIRIIVSCEVVIELPTVVEYCAGPFSFGPQTLTTIGSPAAMLYAPAPFVPSCEPKPPKIISVLDQLVI